MRYASKGHVELVEVIRQGWVLSEIDKLATLLFCISVSICVFFWIFLLLPKIFIWQPFQSSPSLSYRPTDKRWEVTATAGDDQCTVHGRAFPIFTQTWHSEGKDHWFPESDQNCIDWLLQVFLHCWPQESVSLLRRKPQLWTTEKHIKTGVPSIWCPLLKVTTDDDQYAVHGTALVVFTQTCVHSSEWESILYQQRFAAFQLRPMCYWTLKFCFLILDLSEHVACNAVGPGKWHVDTVKAGAILEVVRIRTASVGSAQ